MERTPGSFGDASQVRAKANLMRAAQSTRNMTAAMGAAKVAQGAVAAAKPPLVERPYLTQNREKAPLPPVRPPQTAPRLWTPTTDGRATPSDAWFPRESPRTERRVETARGTRDPWPPRPPIVEAGRMPSSPRATTAMLNTPRPGLKSRAPPWWPVPQPVQECANSFDRAQRRTAGRMAHVLDVLEKDPTSSRAQQQFERELFAMRTYRLHVQPLRITKTQERLEERGALSPRYREAPPQLASHRGGPWRLPEKTIELDSPGLEKPPPPPPPVHAWRLEDSIWAPRRFRADSRGYYDGDTARVAFEVDWAGASEGGALARMILRNDRDQSPDRQGWDASEVDEVRAVLLEHAPLLYNVFDYYASCAGAGGGGTGGGGGSIGDIFAISSAQYKLFVQECELVEQVRRQTRIRMHTSLVCTHARRMIIIARTRMHAHARACTRALAPSPLLTPARPASEGDALVQLDRLRSALHRAQCERRQRQRRRRNGRRRQGRRRRHQL